MPNEEVRESRITCTDGRVVTVTEDGTIRVEKDGRTEAVVHAGDLKDLNRGVQYGNYNRQRNTFYH